VAAATAVVAVVAAAVIAAATKVARVAVVDKEAAGRVVRASDST